MAVVSGVQFNNLIKLFQRTRQDFKYYIEAINNHAYTSSRLHVLRITVTDRAFM